MTDDRKMNVRLIAPMETRVTGSIWGMVRNADPADADLENFLKQTLRDDLPPEAEARMTWQLLSFKHTLTLD